MSFFLSMLDIKKIMQFGIQWFVCFGKYEDIECSLTSMRGHLYLHTILGYAAES